MAIGVAEVNAAGIVSTAKHFHPGVLQSLFNRFTVAGRQPKSNMIHFHAAVDILISVDLEKGDALAAAFEEALPLSLALDRQSEKVDVERSCAGKIFHVKTM